MNIEKKRHSGRQEPNGKLTPRAAKAAYKYESEGEQSQTSSLLGRPNSNEAERPIAQNVIFLAKEKGDSQASHPSKHRLRVET